jgi:flavorubredoxin
MTGRTTKVAEYISQGLQSVDVATKIVNIKNSPIDNILAMALDSDAVLIGSSTRYGDMIGDLEELLKALVKMDFSCKFGAAFGSYGWSGEGIEVINDYLKESSIRLVDTSFLIKALGSDHVQFPLRVQFAPEEDSASRCIEAGRTLGELLLH